MFMALSRAAGGRGDTSRMDNSKRTCQGIAAVGFDENVVGLAGEVLGGEVMPASTEERSPFADKAGWSSGLLNTTGELIAEEGFDGVSFVEIAHTALPRV